MSAVLEVEAVLFDLYGTLIDIWTEENDPEVWMRLAGFLRYRGVLTDAEALYAAFQAAVRTSLRESPEQHPDVDVLGIFQAILRDLGRADAADFGVEAAQLFRVLSIRRFGPFPDALPALAALGRRFKLGLVSDAQRVFLEPEIEIAGLAPFLEAIVVSSDHGFHKPDPRVFGMALHALGVTPAHAVYIGDHVGRDICGARNAGLRALLLDRGARLDTAGWVCRPDEVFSSLDAFRRWVLALAG